MAKYRVLTRSYINNTIVEEGDVVEYDGEASSNLELLEPVKAKGKKAAAGSPDTAPDQDAAGDLV